METTQVTALTSFRLEGVNYREGEVLNLPASKLAEFKRLKLVEEGATASAKDDKPAARRKTKPEAGPAKTKAKDMTTANTGIKPDAKTETKPVDGAK